MAGRKYRGGDGERRPRLWISPPPPREDDNPLGAIPYEVWYEVPLPEGWVGAYRLLPHEGHPLVAEVRVFLDEPGRRTYPGRWSAEQLGGRAPAPSHGLTTAALRKLRVATDLEAAARMIRSPQFRKKLKALFPAETGYVDRTVGIMRQRPARRGRPRTSDAELAEWARDYVEQLSESRRPIAALASQWKVRPETVRDRVHRARSAGMLTPTVRGRASGELTEKAKAILRREERSG